MLGSGSQISIILGDIFREYYNEYGAKRMFVGKAA